MFINLNNDERDNVRTQAMDRGIGSSYNTKSGKSLSRQNYGQLGSNSLLLRPDLNRVTNNLFQPGLGPVDNPNFNA